MGIKGTLWEWIGRATGNHILRSLPRGGDVFHDIEKYLPKHRIKILFDVGANIGQSAQEYTRKFPSTDVFCFEPAPESFATLQQNTKQHPHVRCFQLALAARKGHGRMLLQGSSTMNRLARGSENSSD